MPAVQGVPDLLASLTARARLSHLRQGIEADTHEVVTGRVADLRQAARGDGARLYALEAAMAAQSGFQDGAAIATGRLDAQILAVEAMRAQTDGLGVDVFAAAGREDWTAARLRGEAARQALDGVVEAVNRRHAGRAMFAGTAVDGRATGTAQEILDAASAAIAGAPDAATALAGLETFFLDPAGGYLAMLEGNDQATEVRVAEGRTVAFTATAHEPAFRELMLGLTMASFAASGDIPADDPLATWQAVGSQMQGAQAVLHDLSGELGVLAEASATAGEDAEALRNTIELELGGIVNADPYEAASRLQGRQAQLEAALAIQAATRRLSLVNYL